MPLVSVKTAQRVSLNRRGVEDLVIVEVAGRAFLYPCKDGVEAMHVAVETARVLGTKLGLED